MPGEIIQRVFARLQATYGAAMATVYADVEPALVRAVWAEALADFTIAEMKRGLSAAKSRFPPNLPEFLLLCRPALDPATAWGEAQAAAQSNPATWEWSHPMLREVARDFNFELRTSTFKLHAGRWSAALGAMWASLRPAPADVGLLE